MDSLIAKIYPSKALSKLALKKQKLGPNNSFKLETFVTIRLILTIIIFIISLVYLKNHLSILLVFFV